MKLSKSNLSTLNSQLSTRLGFSLIEILVVFTVISIVSGLGFASFASYSRRQIVLQAASDYKQTIDLARFNALSSVKPASCSSDQLSNYVFNTCSNTTCQTGGVNYEINATCAGIERTVNSKKLPDNVTFSNVSGSTDCATLTFSIVSGVVSGAPCEIYLNGFGNQVKVSVDSNGQASL